MERDMAHEENLPESYPMSCGESPHSYFHHSTYQKGGVAAANKIIKEAIQDKLDFQNLASGNSKLPFCIADFGCSIGPNTFYAVHNIIEAVKLQYNSKREGYPPLEFQVFFNDHKNNDFNSLFKNLPHNHSQNFFVAAVPGSFQDRLFPESTLHFGYSSYALQWFSKIPEELMDPKSPAWNKDSIHCTGFHKEVLTAYSTQFKNDLETFLKARAHEFVSGGFMAIIIPSLPDDILASNGGFGRHYDLLGSCLMDLAKLGLISEEKVQAFNLPFYHASFKEMEILLERNEYFSIERIERMTNTFPVQSITSQIRAFLEEVVKKHFGNEIVDSLFEYFAKKHSENFSSVDEKNHNYTDLFILLKRKIA